MSTPLTPNPHPRHTADSSSDGNVCCADRYTGYQECSISVWCSENASQCGMCGGVIMSVPLQRTGCCSLDGQDCHAVNPASNPGCHYLQSDCEGSCNGSWQPSGASQLGKERTHLMPPPPGSQFMLSTQVRSSTEWEDPESGEPEESENPELAHGNSRVLVLLLKFADANINTLPTREQVNALYNDETNPDPKAVLVKEVGNTVNPTGSIRDVFMMNSQGADDPLRLEAVVTDWIHLERTTAYCASDSEGVGISGTSGSRYEDCIAEALIKLAATGFDFDQFLFDSNGTMKGVGVIHSSHGGEWGGEGNEYRIRSFKGSGIHFPVPGTDREVNTYYTTSVFYGWQGSQMMRFGIACHELSHSLGLPDLYDLSYRGEGLGNYDLMASGYTGFFPSLMSAWSKIKLNWATPIDITESGRYTVKAGESQIYRIGKGLYRDDREYLLLENRQPVGYDSDLPGGGIAIYHIDDTVRRQSYPGWPGMAPVEGRGFPENEWHYRVAMVPADGLYGLEAGTTKSPPLWSATSTLTELGPGGVLPNTDGYYKGKRWYTGIRIHRIGASGMEMAFSVEFQCASAVPDTRDHGLFH